MKKTPTLAAVLLIAATALAGCGINKTPDNDTNNAAHESPTPSSTATQSAELEEPERSEEELWADDMIDYWLKAEGVSKLEDLRAESHEEGLWGIVDYEAPEVGVMHLTLENQDWPEYELYHVIHSFMGMVGWNRPGEFKETTVTTEDGTKTLTMTCAETPGCRTVK